MANAGPNTNGGSYERLLLGARFAHSSPLLILVLIITAEMCSFLLHRVAILPLHSPVSLAQRKAR